MSKVLSVPFFPDTDLKMAFFNDVTVTSALRSVLRFMIFKSHGLSG